MKWFFFHHNLGRNIRNNWKLWGRGKLYKYFLDMGLDHPDDMSSVILKALWHNIHDEPFDPKPEILKYKQFWITNAQKQVDIFMGNGAKANLTEDGICQILNKENKIIFTGNCWENVLKNVR